MPVPVLNQRFRGETNVYAGFTVRYGFRNLRMLYLEKWGSSLRCSYPGRGQVMAAVTQPLRDEHKELLPHVEVLRTVADSAGDASMQALRAGVDEAYEFLAHHLIPHAQAEEQALYPVVGRALGAPGATATMSRDHVEVGRLTQELESLRSQLSDATASASEVQAVRRVLYGLYALVKVHFAKEEEVYLPLLDARLSQVEAQEMFEAMEAAAKAAKRSGLKAS